MSAVVDLDWLDALPEAEKKALLIEAQAELNREKIADYRPYPKQKLFHALGKTKRERLLRAGNQNGKSFCVGAEAAYHLTGEYPSDWEGRRWDRPTVVWATGETGEATRDNPQRVLLGLPKEEGTGAIPSRCLGDYGKASGTADLYDYYKVKHASGGWSMLRFKYYAQGREKWQGPPVDFVWFDEEPPEDIYDEGLARTIATGGMAAMSFTPLQGMSAVVMRFLGDDSTDDRADINMTIEDAEHIPASERARIIASFPAHQRDARAKGIPTLGSGAIFPVDEETIKVAPFAIPDHWVRICGLDFGWDHPTAGSWLAWDRDTDTVYVYDAYRVSEQPIPIHAAAIRAKGSWIPVAWPHDGWQTEKGSGVQLAEQYRGCSVAMLADHATFDQTGNDGDTQQSLVSVEAGLQEMLTRMNTGRWKVFSHLGDWFAEFRLYHRKDGKIVKKFDDLLSSSRYGMMMLRYAIVEPKDRSRGRRPPANWRAC
jgi:phage terminase large subunit-like protein